MYPSALLPPYLPIDLDGQARRHYLATPPFPDWLHGKHVLSSGREAALRNEATQ